MDLYMNPNRLLCSGAEQCYWPRGPDTGSAPDPLLTPDETAEWLRVTKDALANWR